MSPTVAKKTVALAADKNYFEDLVPEAKSVLRRVMPNTGDKKLAKSTAVDILEFAGRRKEAPSEQRPPVLIKDSNVQLLVTAASEIKGFREVPNDES